MAGIKNPYPLCDRDQFPMVTIGDQQQCVAEYLNTHIGQQKIVDVVQRQEITYYVFENRYQLPLLCFCCGVPLVMTKGLDQLRQDMCGRRLESMYLDTAPGADGGEFLEFQLEFSSRVGEQQGVIQSIAPEAAAQMHRPKGDHFSGEPFSKRNKGKRKKKRGFG